MSGHPLSDETKKKIAAAHYKHGCIHTKLYHVWAGMKYRCGNPNCPQYRHYGGRGIRVCKKWRESFVEFRDWALANGYEEGLTIDRIDNNKGYKPSNCRWVGWNVQANNKRPAKKRKKYMTRKIKTEKTE